jgi:pimeloyl-ACP methyl ester carboxylesterase
MVGQQSAVRESRHRVRDIAVRLMRHGQGEPLVFLHGAGGFPPWLPLFEELAKRYEVLIPEHPGFGTSDSPPWIRNIADLAMYYLDFLDELNTAKVHLIGHSLGGWIAAELAVRDATRLASLTLLAPAGVRVKGIASGDNFIWSAEEAERNLWHDQKFADAVLGAAPTEEEADIALTNRFMAAKFGWEPRWFNPALERWLHRIKVPTLVIWGEQDKLFPSAYAKAWKERIPGARVEIIPQCGHRPHVERLDVVGPMISRFLDGGRR